MSDKNSINNYILQVGIVLGIAFSAVIYIAHTQGISHVPGDNLAWINIIIFTFLVSASARQYREMVEGEAFTYKRAFLYTTKINVISAFVLAIFGYFYYNTIAPNDLQDILIQVENAFKQMNISAEQSKLMLQLYSESLSGGTMAFVMFVFQIAGGALFSLLLANSIKWRKPLIIS